MYIHHPRPKACAFRFANRSHFKGRDLSTASCECFRWSCFMTSLETGHALWLDHLNNTNTPVEWEHSR